MLSTKNTSKRIHNRIAFTVDKRAGYSGVDWKSYKRFQRRFFISITNPMTKFLNTFCNKIW